MYGIKWSKVNSSPNVDDVIIVCTGPSLKNFDFNSLRNKGYIIAVNDGAKFVPFANAWFTLDPWGLTTTQVPRNFQGDLFAAVPSDYGTENASNTTHRVIPRKKVNYLHRIAFHTDERTKLSDYLNWGLNEDPSCINTGNSGFGALNLAYHMNPKRVFLFGIDASKGYFFNEKQSTRSLDHLPPIFKSAVPQLNKRGIEVINASPSSRLDCFTKCTLPVALKMLSNKSYVNTETLPEQIAAAPITPPIPSRHVVQEQRTRTPIQPAISTTFRRIRR
jgi:hypothetical protein